MFRSGMKAAGQSIVFSWLVLGASGAGLAQMDPEHFAGMKARSIGPAGMSGRIGAVEAVSADPNIIYVGAATGGLWKSTSGGVRWEPIFDDQPVASIGAVAVFQKNPSILWVGTGEGNPRNSSSVGNGIYKSIDAGKTWQYLGLNGTEKIHRIVLDPDNPLVAYVGALGTTWGENAERGVYKTTDGGKTWRQVLFVDKKTGCADLVMDPSNPNKLIAALWEHRRWPWFFKSGGPGSGIYITYNGGESWKKLTEKEGLPPGDLGRCGLAIARNNPNVVYALVEAKSSALLRSDDGGEKFRTVNKSSNVNPRPFYYADIRVDPLNENRLYSLQSVLTVSEDGGKSFRPLLPFSRVHPDHHALWIHPGTGRILIDGNDGGIAISTDHGDTWRFVENLPLAQFYHINYDLEIPFHVYGGMQDNGSWRGPSELWENGGIRNYHWTEVGFGDGFATLSDPADATRGYSMSQGGSLRRFNLATGERKDIRPPAPDSVKLRFNWNAGIAIDPFDPATVYYGSQFVHKSTDRGDSWTIISPDLTTNDPQKQKQDESGGLTLDVTAAENHTTIMTIAPSPVQRGVIWVGTDDGNVQLTRDGGASWQNVVRNIPNVPANTWCPHIEASKFDAGTAYVVFDDHRRSNWTTYIFKTMDFGKSWKSLARNDPMAGKPNSPWGYAHVIEQDPLKPELLYLGTEFGLFISFDDGEHWMKWTHGLPTVAVRALAVHPRDHALIIGTHGRAAYILDDVRPFRSITPATLAERLHLFEIPPYTQHQIKQVDGYRFPADGMFRGDNRAYGALITYSLALPEKPPAAAGADTAATAGRGDKAKVEIKIFDQSGALIRTMDGPRKKGINRVFWNLRRDGFKQPSTDEEEEEDGRTPPGPEILPGNYTVQVAVDSLMAEQPFVLRPDPRVTVPMAERREKLELQVALGEKIEIIAEAVERLQDTQKAIDVVIERFREGQDPKSKEIVKSGRALKGALATLAEKFIDPPGRQGIYPRDRTVYAKIRYPYGSLGSSIDAPTAAQRAYARQAEVLLQRLLSELNQLFATRVTAFKAQVEEAQFTLFPAKESLDLNWKRKKD